MKYNTLLYPFDGQALPLLRHSALLDNIKITHIVSPQGWGLVGQDAGTIDYGEPIGLQVMSDFDVALEECNTALFTQPDFQLNRNLVLTKIERTIAKNKNVICAYPLVLAEYNTFKHLAMEKKVDFCYVNNNLDYLKITPEFLDKLDIEGKELHTPVVMIFGLIEQISKFDTQLAFSEYLTEQGYKVSLICSRSYGKLFKVHSVPSYMFSRNYTEEEKILLFNNFIKHLENEESPDIFVIGVPGGIIPLNSKLTNRYGITAYEMTREIIPDAAIMCTYFEQYTKKYIDNLNTLCKIRFSTEISAYIVSNTALDLNSRDTPERVSVMPIEHHKIKTLLMDKYPVPVVSSIERDKVFKLIIEELHRLNNVKSF